MPRTEIIRTVASTTGKVFALVAADAVNNMQFKNNDNEVLIVDNAGASEVTITIKLKTDRFGRTGSKVVTVASGEQKIIGPFSEDPYNIDGYVQVDFSSATSVTVGVIKLR